uniref:RNase H type-1 domain-containing protein n=1 Tax=Opuntia streptacantha TaxID=393608 RepID=A0A7C9CL39_OPUST
MVKAAFLLWQLWKARNVIIFRQEVFCPLRTLIRAKQEFAEWKIRTRLSEDTVSRGSTLHRSTSSFLVRWKAPPLGFVKINFDRSLFLNSSAGGFIIRGWGGNLIKAGAAHHGTSSILVAEARALGDGVRAVVETGFKRVLIEGDNAIVIQALQGLITVPWQIAGILHDVSIYLSKMDHVSISHI